MRGAMNWRNVHNTPDVCSAASLWILRGWCMMVGERIFRCSKAKGKLRMGMAIIFFPHRIETMNYVIIRNNSFPFTNLQINYVNYSMYTYITIGLT